MIASQNQPMHTSRSRRSILLGGAILWALSMIAGLLFVCRLENTPGPRGETISQWPADAGLRLVPDRFTLVVGLHPQCPCSRATVVELEEILAQCPGRIAVQVLLYRPDRANDWPIEPLRRRLNGLEGTSNHLDTDGRIVRRFGIATSGHVLLYRPDGKLLFDGGITRGRGLEGDNPGREAVLQCVRSGPALLTTDVFGCPIHEPASR